MRVLLTGWPSFLHGEATAGDIMSMEAVHEALTAAGAECDVAWSPVLRPDGLSLDRADPARYTHLVFACGPAHGAQVEWLHRRYAHCHRTAVGVSVVDPAGPAVTGFHTVLPRDASGTPPRLDLSAASAPPKDVPVVGVVLAPGQPEYGTYGRHHRIEEELTYALASRRCARMTLDTRVDTHDWRHPTTPTELEALVQRLDLVVTTRLHGLVLALKNGIPALAIDPVAGGAKVTAQARAWNWPAVITADEPPYLKDLHHWWTWCLSPEAVRRAAREALGPPSLLTDLITALGLPAG